MTEINNYPVSAHNNYANNNVSVDEKYLEQNDIHSHTTIVETTPSNNTPPFCTNTTHYSWVSVSPPPGYHIQSNRFFKTNVINDSFFKQKNCFDELKTCIDDLNKMLADIHCNIHSFKQG